MNTIIRVPCKATSDTICGPFFEFTFFNNGGEAGDNQGMPEERIPDGPMTSSYRPDTDVAATNDDDRGKLVNYRSFVARHHGNHIRKHVNILFHW